MGLISELKFLEKDKQFRDVSGKYKKEFDFLINLDKHAKAEIKEVIKLVKEGKVTRAAEKLTTLQTTLSKEMLFLGHIEIFCRKNKLNKELRILLDAKRKLWRAMGALNHGGSKIAYVAEKDYVIKKLKEAKSKF